MSARELDQIPGGGTESLKRGVYRVREVNIVWERFFLHEGGVHMLGGRVVNRF